MILVGSQRGGGGALARHLGNKLDNDHIEIAELRGFMSDTLAGAFAEVEAVAGGTKCKQPFFSLSLNPPKQSGATLEDMRAAADHAEQRLGLQGQPRAVVVHEKDGRRHIHVVWSRIDSGQMKAVGMPFFANKLAALSKELFLEHGWTLPEGHRENGWKNPLNFSLAEWQQAKRLGLDPREVKQQFREAWQQSDGRQGFEAALEDRGYFLAKGDRRGFVALDLNGEVFSVARMTGLRTKDVEARLGSPDGMRSVESVRGILRSRISQKLRDHLRDYRKGQQAERAPLDAERTRMVATQRRERASLEKGLEERRINENRVRQARFRTGVRGVWEILTGKAGRIRRENEQEAYAGYLRDRAQREQLFQAHNKDRAGLQVRIDALRKSQRGELMRLAHQVVMVLRDGRGKQSRERSKSRVQSQEFSLER